MGLAQALARSKSWGEKALVLLAVVVPQHCHPYIVFWWLHGVAGVPSSNALRASWLLWLKGLSANLRTKRSQVQFPVRAHVWVAVQVPQWEAYKRQPHTDIPFPPFPSF